MNPHDIVEITKDIQPDQAKDMSGYGLERIIKYTARSRHSYTAMLPSGVPIASFGVNVHPDAQSGTAWGVVGAKAGKYFLGVHRAVQEFLDGCEYENIFMSVRKDFDRGNRWAKMLGFEEYRMVNNHFGEGEHGVLYRRTK